MMSVERVGGVEPETVTLWRMWYAGQITEWPGEWNSGNPIKPNAGDGEHVESCKFVPESALRSVEEELRQARAAHEDAMLAEGHTIETLEADVDRLSRLFDASWADRDRLTRELRQAREERDAIFKVLRESKYGCEYDWEESPVQAVEYIAYQRDAWCEAAEDAEADRDRLAEELRQAREGLAQAHDHITAMENGQHPSHTWVHPEDMPCPDGRHLRYVEHVTKLSWLTDWEWQRQRADRAEADRDRLAAEAVVLKSMLLRRDVAQAHIDDCVASAVLSASAALSPVGQGDPGQETIDGDPQPLGSTITICTGCGYIVRAGDEGFHRECDDGVLIDYERAGDPGQEQGAEWTEYEEGYHDGAMAERKDWQEGGPGSTFLGDRAAAAAGVRSQGPLLTEEDWQSFPTDPETRDTVLDYLAERGYLAVRDDDSEATR